MNQMIQTSSACVVWLLLAPATTLSADNDPISKQETDPAQLSVAPLDHIEYPSGRPDWVSSPPRLDQSPPSWVVVSGPCDSPEESTSDLRLMQRAAVATYIKGLLGAEGRLGDVPIADEWIEKELVVREYEGELTQGGMKRYEHAVEIQFREETREEIVAALRNAEVYHRLSAFGVLVFLGLAGLMCSSAFVGILSRRAQRKDAAVASLV